MYYKRAAFYDTRKNSKAAIIAYTDFVRRFPAADRTEQVRGRLKELKAPQETS